MIISFTYKYRVLKCSKAHFTKTVSAFMVKIPKVWYRSARMITIWRHEMKKINIFVLIKKWLVGYFKQHVQYLNKSPNQKEILVNEIKRILRVLSEYLKKKMLIKETGMEIKHIFKIPLWNLKAKRLRNI